MGSRETTERLDVYRIFLHELHRRACRKGVHRLDLREFFRIHSFDVPVPRLDVIKRIVNSVPMELVADVIQRQPEFYAPEETAGEKARTASNSNAIREGLARAVMTRRCPACGHYCKNERGTRPALWENGQWWCAECLSKHLKGVA